MLCYFFSWVRDKEMPNCLHKLWQVPLQPNKSNKMKRSLNMRVKQRTKQKSSSDIKPFIWQKLKMKQGWSGPCFDTLPLMPYCVNHTFCVLNVHNFHKEGKHGWINCGQLQPYNDIHSKVSYWFPYNMRSKKQVQILHNDDASPSSSE